MNTCSGSSAPATKQRYKHCHTRDQKHLEVVADWYQSYLIRVVEVPRSSNRGKVAHVITVELYDCLHTVPRVIYVNVVTCQVARFCLGCVVRLKTNHDSINTRSPAVARIANRAGWQWPSRSSKVDDHLIWKGICHFLSVNYSNLGPITRHLRDMATYSLKL